MRELYQQQLIDEGVLTADEAAALRLGGRSDATRGSRSSEGLDRRGCEGRARRRDPAQATGAQAITAVAADKLVELNDELLATPEEFTVHPKLARQLERRRTAMDEGGIDWGHAEALAFASLLIDGIPVRLTGQDVQRGTFAQRHLVCTTSTPARRTRRCSISTMRSTSFEVYNSPLSEYACMGFEYGYSVAAPEALVLWEAQYGDFANGAQIVIDQFISSAMSKWRETSRLTLLLPHGYEGNGPEHSSARLERFLQLGAQENLRIANCTTAAQYFHLLRRQALDATARPLVIVTPKGLLRLKDATSALADLAGRELPAGARRSARRTRKRCAGSFSAAARCTTTSSGMPRTPKLQRSRSRESNSSIRSRPTPLRRSSRSYPSLDEVVWAQEEPQNMGPWRSIRHRLEEASGQAPLRYIGRPWRASPSEGYPTAHLIEQDRIARDALTV